MDAMLSWRRVALLGIVRNLKPKTRQINVMHKYVLMVILSGLFGEKKDRREGILYIYYVTKVEWFWNVIPTYLIVLVH